MYDRKFESHNELRADAIRFFNLQSTPELWVVWDPRSVSGVSVRLTDQSIFHYVTDFENKGKR